MLNDSSFFCRQSPDLEDDGYDPIKDVASTSIARGDDIDQGLIADTPNARIGKDATADRQPTSRLCCIERYAVATISNASFDQAEVVGGQDEQ